MRLSSRISRLARLYSQGRQPLDSAEVSQITRPVSSISCRRARDAYRSLLPLLERHAENHYDPDVWMDAWQDFQWRRFNERPPAHLQCIFRSWWLFGWVPPDNILEPALRRPAMAVAKHYLRSHPSTSTVTRHLIGEVSAQPFSFFSLGRSAADASRTARDLLLDRCLTVDDAELGHLEADVILYGRVVSFGGACLFLGQEPIALPPTTANTIARLRQELDPMLKPADLRRPKYDNQLRETYLDIIDGLI